MLQQTAKSEQKSDSSVIITTKIKRKILWKQQQQNGKCPPLVLLLLRGWRHWMLDVAVRLGYPETYATTSFPTERLLKLTILVTGFCCLKAKHSFGFEHGYRSLQFVSVSTAPGTLSSGCV